MMGTAHEHHVASSRRPVSPRSPSHGGLLEELNAQRNLLFQHAGGLGSSIIITFYKSPGPYPAGLRA
jgi:hypothetical protein